MTSEKSKFVANRPKLENLLKRRFFICPSFEIYGGVAGLYDFGPPGCALKAEIESFWRRHFVLAENMLEVGATCMTPEVVLKTSGHVDRFTDLMVKDEVSGECYRADKLLEEVIEKKLQGTGQNAVPAGERESLELLARQADALSATEMDAAFKRLDIKSPDNPKNSLSSSFPFNLMFKTAIGPKGDSPGYLRPETAQGIFVNFRRLLEYNGGRMPFAAAQLGLGFRNEIAPRAGLLRVREFQMAEIEHFVHPNKKDHPKFVEVRDLKIPLFPRDRQTGDGRVVTDKTIGEAVKSGLVDNESLGYFVARTYLFLRKIGILASGLRFRQHLSTEMAHYATDCWDAEILTSYGWIECVGIADRSAYDLAHHGRASKVDLVAHDSYDAPRTVEYVKFTPNRGVMGPTFKEHNAKVLQALEDLPDDDKMAMQKELDDKGEYTLKLCTGETFQISSKMVKFEKTTKTVNEEVFVPAVIEPSFGIGRIVYCLLEHAFRSRGIAGQEQRCVFEFPPEIAPTKVSILPISSGAQFEPSLRFIQNSLNFHGVSSVVDSSSVTIGRRYARTDEIGIPFGITVDFQSLKDQTVTVRDRDSTQQIRVKESEVGEVVKDMVAGRRSWEDMKKTYPIFVQQEVEQ